MRQRSCHNCEYKSESVSVTGSCDDKCGCPVEVGAEISSGKGCYWVRGMLRDGDHPSELGVIIGEAEHQLAGQVRVFVEVVSGALVRADVQRILRRMLADGPVLIRDAHGDELLTGVDDADMLLTSMYMMAA
ncbi:hypothetical protein [Poriferisphaera sp. WC338]|uniref:hypothetical protein n=1 Tax=Poriferisphaera sp. WC338 TaxID=3425129 RepID=UPI003D813E13